MTLVAVYDSIVEDEQTEETVQEQTKHLYEPSEVQTEVKVGTCVYAREIKPNSGKYICTYNRVNPRENRFDPSVQDERKLIVNCPRINELNIPFHEENDFGFGTILEISDISKLLNALFKVNIDIAHREYYLKKDIQQDSGWWYGQVMEGYKVVCDPSSSKIICKKNPTDYPIVCTDDAYPFITKWISFEPTVELKFSNLHASNQIVDGKLVCSVDRSKDGWENGKFPSIVPINRDLANDNRGIHYNDFLYCYDYVNRLEKVVSKSEKDGTKWETDLNDSQKHYNIEPLHLYDNSKVQSPIDSRDFVKCRRSEISRSGNQVQTFTSIVKKYRPIVVPKVSDIFNDCIYKTRYEAY